MKNLLIADFDGTLLRKSKKQLVSDLNLLKKENIDLIIATGRTKEHMFDYVDEITMKEFCTKFVFSSGSVLIDLEKEYEKIICFKEDDLAFLISLLEERDGIYVLRINGDEYIDASNYKEKKVTQINVKFFNETDTYEFIEIISVLGLEVKRVSKEFLSITPQGSSKISGALKFMEEGQYTNIRAIGNDSADISFLAHPKIKGRIIREREVNTSDLISIFKE